jgi:hypothetical protein
VIVWLALLQLVLDALDCLPMLLGDFLNLRQHVGMLLADVEALGRIAVEIVEQRTLPGIAWDAP